MGDPRPNRRTDVKTALLATSLVAMLIGMSQAHAGYRAATKFEQVKAECELFADGTQPSGGFIMGSPEYVAGASIGRAIGGAISHANHYNQCMTLHGFVNQE